MVNVLPQVAKFKGIALDLLFPRWCIGCGREGGYICRRCQQSLSFISPPVCPRCGLPQPDGELCPTCAGSSNTGIDGIRSPFLFEGVIRRAIHELKYRNLRALAPLLARWLYEYLQRNPVPGGVLVPVPLHRKRLRERGYNQSALLAKELSKLAGLPLAAGCLVRHQAAAPQARTDSAAERKRNVTGAFSCPEGGLWGEGVILVDDVATSGATLNAGADALKAAGAASVWGLTVALEPLKSAFPEGYKD
jgi:ComF family protein